MTKHQSHSSNADAENTFVPMPIVQPGHSASFVVRILPPRVGESIFQAIRFHGPNNELTCPKPRTLDGWDDLTFCPICNYLAELISRSPPNEWDSKTFIDQEWVNASNREIGAREEFWYNVRIHNHPQIETPTIEYIYILKAEIKLHNVIYKKMQSLGCDPTNAQKGYDLTFVTDVDHNGVPDYSRSEFAEISSRLGIPEHKQSDYWLRSQPNLGEIVNDLRNESDFATLEHALDEHLGPTRAATRKREHLYAQIDNLFQKCAYVDATMLLTDAINDVETPLERRVQFVGWRGNAYWYLANNSLSLTNKLDYFKASNEEYRQMVSLSPDKWISEVGTFPEISWAVSGYIAGLSRESAMLDAHGSKFSTALVRTGQDGAESLSALQKALNQTSFSPTVRMIQSAIYILSLDVHSQKQFEITGTKKLIIEVIARIGTHSLHTSGTKINLSNEIEIEEEYTYTLTQEYVLLSEEELLRRTSDFNDNVRVAACCLLGLTVQHPSDLTIQSLMKISKDRLLSIRCEAIRALGVWAADPQTNFCNELFEVFVRLLENDRSYHVRRLAAEAIGLCGLHEQSAVKILTEALQRTDRKSVKAHAKIIQALGRIGIAAKSSLSAITSFVPKNNYQPDNHLDQIIKAEAILKIIDSSDHPQSKKSIEILTRGLRYNFFQRDTDRSGVRKAALASVMAVPIERKTLTSLLIERTLMDTSARIRRMAALHLIQHDPDTAKRIGASREAENHLAEIDLYDVQKNSFHFPTS